jgi:hypothetical protein
VDGLQLVTMTALFDGEASTLRQVLGLKEEDMTHNRLLCAHVGRPTPSESEYRMLRWHGRAMCSRAGCYMEAMGALVSYSCANGQGRMSQRVCAVLYHHTEYERHVQRCERSSCAVIPESKLDESILTARYKESRRQVPLDSLDVPSLISEDPLLSALHERLDAHGRVVAGRGEALVILHPARN